MVSTKILSSTTVFTIDIFKYIFYILNSDISQYYSFYYIYVQINAALWTLDIFENFWTVVCV